MGSDPITITKLPAVAGDWSTGKLFSRGTRTAHYLSEKGEGKSSRSPFRSKKIADPETSTLCSAQSILLTHIHFTTWANHPFCPGLPTGCWNNEEAAFSPQPTTHPVNKHLCFIIIFFDTACFNALYCI